MTTAIDRLVAQPGVYDLPDDVYHGDPVPGGSLSSTGARKLLPPSCPARFKWDLDHPTPYKKTFDIGHAAHKLVLGVGPELVCVDRPRWDTKEVKAEVAAIRAAGAVPLKADEYAQVQGMADALRRHPFAGALFNPAAGKPEQSLFWVDDETGIWCRAKLDWQPFAHSGRMVVPDYKSTTSADPDHIRRTVGTYSYHCQAAWYLDGIVALDLAEDPAFVFVCQEKNPPYLVTVVQIDDDAEQVGRERNRRAIDTYRRCQETDEWPGYSSDVEVISLPAWVARQHDEETQQ